MDDSNTVGSFELVSFKDLKVNKVIAKIDTGAYSGALHATDIRETAGKDGTKRLEFQPLGHKDLKTTTTQYRRKSVKSSNGQQEVRYIINTKVTIKGKDYPMIISLSDRSRMMKPVLIGRQFLRKHGLIVDVQRGLDLHYKLQSGAES